MAEDTASLVLFYAREGAGGAISLEKRVAASWNAACPGQEILHGVQYLGTLADPNAYGGGMKQKLAAMDAAAHGYASAEWRHVQRRWTGHSRVTSLAQERRVAA